MRRILVIHCPSVRSTAGSSFGPITRSATTPMMTSLPQQISNMASSLAHDSVAKPVDGRSAPCQGARACHRQRPSWPAAGRASGVGLRRASRSRRAACIAVAASPADRSIVFAIRLGGGSVLATSSSDMPFLNALMPCATSPISSEILPRPNSSKHHHDHDDPVPNAQGTHEPNPPADGLARPVVSAQNLGSGRGKNKDFGRVDGDPDLAFAGAGKPAPARAPSSGSSTPLTVERKLLDLAEKAARFEPPRDPGPDRTQRNALRPDRHHGGAALRAGPAPGTGRPA